MNKHTDAPYGGLSGVPSDFNKRAGLRKKAGNGLPAVFARDAGSYVNTAAKSAKASAKRAQHKANLALRREMNQAAALSPGKNMRPFAGMSAS